MPATFPHLTAFPMAMALMTRRSFPIPVLGLVHIRNEITQSRPFAADARLDFRVWIEPPRTHPKGVAFDVCAQAWDTETATDGNPPWTSISTYLRRMPAPPSLPPQQDLARQPNAPTLSPAATDLWQLPSSLGRRYASVSGDRNPIHLHPWTARAFGFPRAIAHGMWTKARCLAALTATSKPPEGLPAAFRIQVDFRAPVLLPSQVSFSAETASRRFAVRSPDGLREHLVGELTVL